MLAEWRVGAKMKFAFAATFHVNTHTHTEFDPYSFVHVLRSCVPAVASMNTRQFTTSRSKKKKRANEEKQQKRHYDKIQIKVSTVKTVNCMYVVILKMNECRH